MTLYIVGLVITIVAWAITTTALTIGSYDTSYGRSQEQRQRSAKKARLAWLSFFLIPLYPAVLCVVALVGPIMVFRSLGRINKEEQ